MSKLSIDQKTVLELLSDRKKQFPNTRLSTALCLGRRTMSNIMG